MPAIFERSPKYLQSQSTLQNTKEILGIIQYTNLQNMLNLQENSATDFLVQYNDFYTELTSSKKYSTLEMAVLRKLKFNIKLSESETL